MASILNATTSTGFTVTPDNSGSLQLATNNGTTAVTIDTSQNVGIGTASPSTKLHVASSAATSNILSMTGSTTAATYLQMNNTGGNFYIGSDNSAGTSFGGAAYSGNLYISGAYPMIFYTNSAERMRLNSAGTLFIGGTSSPSGTQRLVLTANGSAGIEPMLFNELRSTSATENYVLFYRNGSQVGSITNTLSATAYNTSSDYRLKENIAPMTGALAKVAQLKPVTYTWKVDGSNGQGFIAHELQAVVPDCVSGEKDAVDADGNPKYQGIDTSFLVATLTASIQELKAIVDAQAERIAVLESK